MKVAKEGVEAYRRVACRLKWFSLQGMRCVERVLDVWGYHIGYLAATIQPRMLHMTCTSVGVGGVP